MVTAMATLLLLLLTMSDRIKLSFGANVFWPAKTVTVAVRASP